MLLPFSLPLMAMAIVNMACAEAVALQQTPRLAPPSTAESSTSVAPPDRSHTASIDAYIDALTSHTAHSDCPPELIAIAKKFQVTVRVAGAFEGMCKHRTSLGILAPPQSSLGLFALRDEAVSLSVIDRINSIPHTVPIHAENEFQAVFKRMLEDIAKHDISAAMKSQPHASSHPHSG